MSARQLRSLPATASLRFLKLEAKRFLKSAHAAGTPRGKDGPLVLAEAQHLLAREYGFASWALLKLRVAELAFARASIETQRGELIDAVCAWGWDHDDHPATPELAERLVAGAPRELVRGDFVLACITGDVEAVEAALARDPALAITPAAPRGWPPLLYTSYAVLLRPGRALAPRLVEVARLLLAHGADPNSGYTGADGSRFPALYAAIAVADNLALARALLDAGATPNDGQSLYHAAERFDTDALDLLFAHALDPASVSYCLLHKIDFQHEPGIRWFLDHGADPNVRHPQSGETALHWAIKRASPPSIVELLLARGADRDARTKAGVTAFPTIRAWTPLDLAKRLARADLVALLHGAAETPPTDEDLLVFAALAGDPSPVVDRIAPIDRDLVAHVAQQDEGAVVSRLAALGWPLDARGWMSATPLHWAACRGNAALARDLLGRGAPQLDVGGYFRTPLHTALYCRWKRADAVGVVEALVAAGAELPATLAPTGDADLDAAVARLRRPR